MTYLIENQEVTANIILCKVWKHACRFPEAINYKTAFSISHKALLLNESSQN